MISLISQQEYQKQTCVYIVNIILRISMLSKLKIKEKFTCQRCMLNSFGSPKYKQGSSKDGWLFFRTFCFSLNLTGMLNLTKVVHYYLSRMGK